MVVSKIAFRNIFRQRRRSFLTSLTMIVGFVLLSISFAFAEGGYGNMIDMFTRGHTGHVQIHVDGYLEKPNIYKNFPLTDKFEDTIKSVKYFESLAPRIYSPALAFVDGGSVSTFYAT